MKRNKFIIVGLGEIGQELLRKLSKDFEIICIDLNPDAEETAKKIREDCKVIIGDSTSRLVLEKSGVADADGIILTTKEEKINIETARLLRENFDSKRVISVGATREGIDALETQGAEVENIFTASAIAIRNRIEQASRAAHAIGLGKNEILEVEVHPHSRLANKPLRNLTPVRWRIGTIYRDENIIIPKRDTILKPKDRVVILGEPSVLKTVAEILTFRFQRFPLEYGATVIAYLSGIEQEDFFNEVDYLFSILPLNRIVWVYSKKASEKSDYFEEQIRKDNIKDYEIKHSSLDPLIAISQAIDEIKGDHGLILVSKSALNESLFPYSFSISKKKFLKYLLINSACPILLSMGTIPYTKTIVPCVEDVNLQHSLETALEISSSLNNEVSAVLAKPSKYISSDDDIKKFEELKKTINDLSVIYKVRVKTELLDGNPVKLITGSLMDYNLLIADVIGWKNQKWFSPFLNPDIMWHIIKATDISTLLLPHVEESL
jgi:Trk K+ transport system NAD-binding subunit